MKREARYTELSARERILHLVDPGSFSEYLAPSARIMSPHLAQFNLPPAFDDGVVIGKANLQGNVVYIAAQVAEFMGGAIGEVHGAKLTGLCLKALKTKPQALIVLFDSGGVRLHEANAGESAIAEMMQALLALKAAGVLTVAVIAGKNGAFGGAGILSACFDYRYITEEGRSGVSGPEVIQTVMGTEEYDADDRALVWRTCGGKHRALMGDALYTSNSVAAIQAKLLAIMNLPQTFDLASLNAEHALLAERFNTFSKAKDGTEIWQALGVEQPLNIPNLNDADFLAELARIRTAP